MKRGWWSQPFAPEGSAAAEGIAEQLGRPTLDPLTVLVREAAQNSWDARAAPRIWFNVDIRTLGDSAGKWSEIFALESHTTNQLTLAETSHSPSTVVLTISDRNTRGLGGPIRAGERAHESETADFVQFIRNVGEPSDHKFGGGTYGFGKGIFYRLSSTGTIIVDSLAHGDTERPRRRLMGAALGRSYYLGDRRFTGRHWWGNIGDDGIPDPLLNDEAAAAAQELGLPGFDDGRTGTDICVVAAVLGCGEGDTEGVDRSPTEAAEFMVSSILWHLWPKFLPDDAGNAIDFGVSVNGQPVAVPSPDTLPEFTPFIEGLQAVRRGSGTQYTRSVAPKLAGLASLHLCASGAGRNRVVDLARPIETPLHHIARMRLAELVVDYQEGAVHPDPLFGYAGVFRCSEDSDAFFARAEPPTHDAWIAKGLTGAARGTVLGVTPFLRRRVDELIGGQRPVRAGGAGLGGLALRLGTMMSLDRPNQPETSTPTRPGGTRNTGEGSSTSSGPMKRAVTIDQPRIVLHGSTPVLAATVTIPGGPIVRTLRIEPRVVTQGGAIETDAPVGSSRPTVLGWRRTADEPMLTSGPTIVIAARDEAVSLVVEVSHVPDAVVRLVLIEEH